MIKNIANSPSGDDDIFDPLGTEAPAAPAPAPCKGPAGGTGLSDDALVDLASRLAPLLAREVLPPTSPSQPPVGAAGAGSVDAATLERVLDAWAADHLAPGAARPGALLRELIGGAAAAGKAGGKAGAAGEGALVAAAAAAAAAATQLQAPGTPRAAAPGKGAAAASSPRSSFESGSFSATSRPPAYDDSDPDANTIHDGYWEWLADGATKIDTQRSDSVTTTAGGSTDYVTGQPSLPDAWATRPGWEGPACERVCAPVAALAQALLRGGDPGALGREVAAERSLPPRAAAQLLLQRHAGGLVGRLAALVSASGDARHETEWLMSVLRAVASRLGLLESGMVLATMHARFGRDDLLDTAAAIMLPSPAARLRCLLLHWALLPQLAAAALPALPAPVLVDGCLAAAADGARSLSADEDETPVSTILPQKAPSSDPSPLDPLWMGLNRIDPAALADIILACDSAIAAAAAAGAGAPAPLSTVLRGVVREMRPAAPAALLLAGHLAAGAGGAGRARRLLALLLRACAGGGEEIDEAPITLGDGIAHALWQVSKGAGGQDDGDGAAARVSTATHQRFVEAAARVLLSLPPQELAAAASELSAAAEAGGGGVAELCARAVALAAEGADQEQALGLLATPLLPQAAWDEVWAVVVSPVRGTFCASARGLSEAMVKLPAGDAARLAAAWSGLLAHRAWAEVGAEVRGAAAARHGVTVEDVLGATLLRAPLPAGAAHLAALARLVPAGELAHLAGAGMAALEATAHGAAAAGAVAWLLALRELRGAHPELADAPRALRALCVAASALPESELPLFMPAAAAAAAAERRRRDGSAGLALLYKSMASGRAGGDLQGLLLLLAAAAPPEHAAAMLQALGDGITSETRDALVAAAEDGESIWQMGNRWTPPAAKTTPAAAPRAAAATPAALAAAEEEGSWPTVRELRGIVAQIPHAPPPGGSEDAMQDPERVAGLLRRAMVVLSEPGWRPGRSEAAAAAAQLGLLAAKRGWGDGDLAGLLCRLPPQATLRLLMVASAAHPVLAARRPALLSALARWHGAGGLAEQMRALYVDERAFSLGDVVSMLADARQALDGAAAAVGSDGGFVSAATFVLGDLRGVSPPGAGAARHTRGAAAAAFAVGGSGEGSDEEEEAMERAAARVVAPAAAAEGGAARGAVTAGEFAELACLVHALAPAGVARALLREAGASLGAPALAAVGAALPRAARRTLGKGRALAAELAAIIGCEVPPAAGEGPEPHAAGAERSLRAAADTGGTGAHAGRAESALRAAASSPAILGGRDAGGGATRGAAGAQSSRAEAALRAAAATGAGAAVGSHAARAEAALAAAAGAPKELDPRLRQQLDDIAALIKAAPGTDATPYLRRAARGAGAARALLLALPQEAGRLPLGVTAPLLALVACEAEWNPEEWEAALLGTCDAVDASSAAAPPAVLDPLSRRAYAAGAPPRDALLRRAVRALQQVSRPNRDAQVAAYAAVLRASAAATPGGGLEPAARLLEEMISPSAPVPKWQGLGASGAARLACLLLSGPPASLPAADVLVPALGRAFTGKGDASSWFARAASDKLPLLPLARAALGLTLLQPALAAAKALRQAELAVAAAHGREATAAALEAVWRERHGGSVSAEAAAAGGGAADGADGPGSALVAVPKGDDDVEEAEKSSGKGGVSAEGASVLMLGVASLAVAARVAGRVFGVGQPAGRMLFGSWWVLGATAAAAALLTEMLVSQEGEEDED